MALSGSFSASVRDGHYTLRVQWTASQSAANNTSTITAKVYLVHDWTIDIGSRTGNTLNIAGKAYTFTSPAVSASSGTHLLATITSGAIAHNSDGSKSVSMSCAWNMRATITANGTSTYHGTINASTTAILDAIPRASQPSLVTWPETTNHVGDFGEEFPIHMNRKSSAFTHTVSYGYGNRSSTIATDVTTGTTWAVPLSFMNDIPNATSASGRIYVTTWNGGTMIGTKYTGFTVTVPDSVKPGCSLTLEDVNGIDEIYGSPVQGLSKIKITVNTTPAYGSPIESSTIKANGVTYSGTTATTDVLRTAGSSPVTATVKDQRGRTGTASYTMNVQAYAPPSITQLTVRRCDEDGNENDQGEFVRATFTASITSLSNLNTAEYVLRYKKTAETSFTEITLDDLANVYAVTESAHIFPADGSSSYDVEIVATDRHSSTSRSTSASTAFTLINWGDDGTSMAFGKVAEKPNTLEIALDVEFIGKVRGSIFDAIYPVGSIYLAYNHTNPATLFGGTWVRIENRFVWGVDASGTIGQTGGEKTHTLTAKEMPEHSHQIGVASTATGSNAASNKIRYNNDNTNYNGIVNTVTAGDGDAHNNMPPYIQVSIWRRTA